MGEAITKDDEAGQKTATTIITARQALNTGDRLKKAFFLLLAKRGKRSSKHPSDRTVPFSNHS